MISEKHQRWMPLAANAPMGRPINIFLVALAIGSVLVGVPFPKISIATGIVLAVYLVWRMEYDCLLPLLILYILATDLSFNSLVDDSKNILLVHGVPLTPRIAITFTVPMRVFYAVVAERTRNRKIIFCAVIFVFGLVPIVVGTYLGWMSAVENWTRPLRFLCLASAFFYGLLIGKGRSCERDLVRRVYAPFVCVGVGMLAIGLIHQHFRYFIEAAAGCLVGYAFMRRGVWRWLICPFLIAAGIKAAASGTFSDTLLLGAGWVIGIVPYTPFKKIAFSLPSFVATLFLVVGFVIGTIVYAKATGIESIQSTVFDSTAGKIRTKIAGDRAELWVPAFEQIINGPYIIVPSARPIILSIDGVPVSWYVGCHDAMLECFRTAGLIGGLSVLVLVWYAVFWAFKTLKVTMDPDCIVLAATTVTLAVIGLCTEDYVLDQDVAFWAWSSAGIALTLVISARGMGFGMRPHLRQNWNNRWRRTVAR